MLGKYPAATAAACCCGLGELGGMGTVCGIVTGTAAMVTWGMVDMVGMVGPAMDTIGDMVGMLLVGIMAPSPPTGMEAIATDMARELSSLDD